MANLMQGVRSLTAATSANSATSATSQQAAAARFLALQHREITPNDYNTLLSLDAFGGARRGGSSGRGSGRSSSNGTSFNLSSTQTIDQISLSDYLVDMLATFGGSKPSRRELMLVQQQQASSQRRRAFSSSNAPGTTSECVACHETIAPTSPGVRLPCSHRLHVECLKQTFESGHYCCPLDSCGIPIFRGLDRVCRKKENKEPLRERPSSSESGPNQIPIQQLLGPSMHIMGISTGVLGATGATGATGVLGGDSGSSRGGGRSTARTVSRSSRSSRSSWSRRLTRSSGNILPRQAPRTSNSMLEVTGTDRNATGVMSTNNSNTNSNASIRRRRPLSEHQRFTNRRSVSQNSKRSNAGLAGVTQSGVEVASALEVQVVAAQIHLDTVANGSGGGDEDGGGLTAVASDVPAVPATPSMPATPAVPPPPPSLLEVVVPAERAMHREQLESRPSRTTTATTSRRIRRPRKRNLLGKHNANQSKVAPNLCLTPAALAVCGSKPSSGRLLKGARAQRLRPRPGGGGERMAAGFQAELTVHGL